MESFSHHSVRVNGIRMHYVTAGSGPLVVLLHGFPECWYSWRHQIPVLSEHFTVVAPDLRGFNDTDKPMFVWDYRIDVLVKDIITLIHAVGYDRAYIVGHDLGGLLSWYIGIHHPKFVERLIVLNVPHPVLFAESLHINPIQMFRSTYISLFQLPFIPELLISANNYAMLDVAMRGTAVNKEAFTDEDMQFYKNALKKPGAMTAALNWYRAFVILGGNMNTFLGKHKFVRVPTLLIWGEKDPFLGVGLTRGTERFVSDLRVAYVPESAHWVQQEQPEIVNQYILDFLAPAPAAGTPDTAS